MAPTVFRGSITLPGWGVDLYWQASHDPPGAWTISASVTLPPSHPVLPGKSIDYEVTTIRELVSGPPSAADVQAALEERFALPCFVCAMGCLELADRDQPAKVSKAYRTLLRCGLNPLIFQLDLNETLDLHTLFSPLERHREPLMDTLLSRPGLRELIGNLLVHDLDSRESFGRLLQRDIVATADQGRLGGDRIRSFVAFCRTRLQYLVHDTRRFFLARKTGATLFLTHYITARALQQLLKVGGPVSGSGALDRSLRRAQRITDGACLHTCEAYHARLKEPAHYARFNWVCRHCVPGTADLSAGEATAAEQLSRDLGSGTDLDPRQQKQLQRTSMRHAHYRICMTGSDGAPLVDQVKDYMEARGLTPEQVSSALSIICVKGRQDEGAPCQLGEDLRPGARVLRVVAEFIVEVLSRLQQRGGDEPLKRLLSCIFAETRHTLCSRLKRCKVFIFRDIQYSRLGPDLLDLVRRSHLLPEDLLWYFWYTWAEDPDPEYPRKGTSFVGDCKRELDERVRRRVLGPAHADVLRAQLFSYFPDEMGLVPLWHLREALPGCERVLSRQLPDMPGPWNTLDRATCWELLMKHEDGPKVPAKGVTSYEELMLYKRYQVSLEQLAERGIEPTDE